MVLWAYKNCAMKIRIAKNSQKTFQSTGRSVIKLMSSHRRPRDSFAIAGILDDLYRVTKYGSCNETVVLM